MFEKFNRESTSKSSKGRGNFGKRPPAIGLAREGIFTMNPAAYEELGNPSFVELFFDKIRSRVGIKVVEDATPESFSIRIYPNSQQYRINGRTFAKHYGIHPSNNKPFPLEKEGEFYTFHVAADGEETDGAF